MDQRTPPNNLKVDQIRERTTSRALQRRSIHRVMNRILCGPADQILKQLPDESVDCVVTSPPYWALRDYGVNGQLGLESTVAEYINKLGDIFDEVQRILKKSGTCWINIGDTYYSNVDGGNPTKVNPEVTRQLRSLKNRTSSRELPRKSLCQIPSRLALEMANRGWILRNEIIWHKPNCMPSSVKDRFTVDFEKLFFFVKSKRYFFVQQFEELRNRARLTRPFFKPHSDRKRRYGDKYISALNPQTAEASRLRILKRGRNKRCVWSIGTRPFAGSHFAVYPPQLIETPIKAGCPEGGVVLDPFMGSGTTALVAQSLSRSFIGIDLNPAYVQMTNDRLKKQRDLAA
jgi:DNA modification methylase